MKNVHSEPVLVWTIVGLACFSGFVVFCLLLAGCGNEPDPVDLRDLQVELQIPLHPQEGCLLLPNVLGVHSGPWACLKCGRITQYDHARYAELLVCPQCMQKMGTVGRDRYARRWLWDNCDTASLGIVHEIQFIKVWMIEPRIAELKDQEQ